MKRPWDRVILTRTWWEGPEPEAGDGLQTRTGRTYLIISVRGKKLECLVLPPDEPIEGRMFEWHWNSRRRA